MAALRPRALPAAAAVLVLWALSPEIAQRIARPRGKGAERLGPEETRFLRRLARRTWLFFETFVGPEDHWLPPDNLQEHPRYEVAHRTSPTNVGMALLSTLAAADFGYLASSELVVRVRNTLETLARVPRYRGHVLNWIDTRALEPLEPRFVSTVDSGNLAVSLVTLEQGCLELARGSALRPQLWDGLLDVLALLGDALAGVGQPAGAQACVAAMEACARDARAAPERRRAALTRPSEIDRPALDAALAEAGDRESAPAEALRELRIWLERTHHHLRAMQRELEELAPWWELLDAPPPACEPLARTLRALLSPGLLLAELEARCGEAAEQLGSVAAEVRADPDAERWVHDLRAALEKGATAGAALGEGLRAIAADAGALAWGMDFAWLYDPDTRRLRIGYNASADRPDPNHYDLLASEARLASFFAIAKGDAPLEHWFHLGRPITRGAGGLALLSWGGSMFEYLMPPLLLRSQSGTLLAQSERAAVDTQRRWAA
jgi:cyclic beta-1,2-glucan synthetase